MFIASQIALVIAISIAPTANHGNVDHVAEWSGAGCAGIAVCTVA